MAKVGSHTPRIPSRRITGFTASPKLRNGYTSLSCHSPVCSTRLRLDGSEREEHNEYKRDDTESGHAHDTVRVIKSRMG
jgi:hypothetical protein